MFPEFWVQTPLDGGPAGSANGVHFAFFANFSEELQAFYDTAISLGATDGGAPGHRP